MVDWKRIEIIAGQDAEAHIKKHGVSIPEVFNVLNSRTYSRKIKAVGETRYAILGESQGRILMVILIQQSTQSFYLLTAYEPSDGYKKLYGKDVRHDYNEKIYARRERNSNKRDRRGINRT